MTVKLYSGSLGIVKKSGVGQAFLHQQKMLELVKIKTVTNGKKYDIVHFNTVFPDSLFHAIIARLRHIKVIYYAHSTMEDFKNSFKYSNKLAPLFKKWLKLCYNLGNIIITPTKYSKKLIKSYGIKKPIYSLSNGIDTDFFCFNDKRRQKFREKYNIADSEKAVISVGHYIERKGIVEFIQLAKKMPEHKFFWFGYTNLNLIPHNVRKAIENAPKNLCFAGYVSREELRDAYCGCDLFDFMSFEETEGIVVLEALACSIPVVVRKIPVYDGWLKDGINVYKAANQKDFYRLTADILSGKSPCITNAGRTLAENRSLNVTGKQLANIYSTL